MVARAWRDPYRSGTRCRSVGLRWARRAIVSSGGTRQGASTVGERRGTVSARLVTTETLVVGLRVI
jgi:hypothetical protein